MGKVGIYESRKGNSYEKTNSSLDLMLKKF